MAVIFKCKVLKHSDEYLRATDELEETKRLINDLNKQPLKSIKETDAKFITCRSCNSEVATRFIRNNYCPVCGKDLRPESTAKQVRELNSKSLKLSFLIDKLNRRDIEAGETTDGYKWLTKVEYQE